MRPTIALCLIAKNEAHNLTPLLQSVRGCFDEIHLTDTGSTDNTLDFVDKINGHIDAGNAAWSGLPKIEKHHFTWINDFSAARNYSFSFAKSEYVMWMDLDDALSSAEEFIKWRDTVLHAAHYWMAIYNYNYDSDGKPDCQFVRERVVKNNYGFGWKYFVHEGLVQEKEKSFWPARVTTWTVNHRRTEDDRKADHNRNLQIFELHDYEKLEPRMKYYYGKELLESGKAVEAGKPLLEALKNPELQLHDRVLAYQFAAQSAMAAGAFPQVIDLSYNCLRLIPGRAESYCLIGDAHMRTGALSSARQAYKLALTCQPDVLGGTVIVHAPAYHEYPHVQLANLALNEGNSDRAKEHLQALELTDSAKCQEIRNAIYQVEQMSTVRTGLPKVEDIVIICPPHGAVTDWDENSLEKIGHGGSETAAIEVAKSLHAKTGRPVKIFQPRSRRETMASGVEYVPIGDLQGYIQNVEPRAVINWRHPNRLSSAPTYVWCHDLVCPGAERGTFESIFALSEFHKNYLHQIQGIPFEKIKLLTNGINPKDFEVGETEKDPLKIVFSSSPDRGLDRAIRIIEKAREISGLDLELHCFYGFKNMRMNGGAMAELADQIEAMMSARPWVKYHGMVTKKDLMRHFKEASTWIYPANFIETYCITAIEALVAGVYPIVRDMGALKYTMKEAIDKDMCEVMSVDCETEAEVGLWANRVVESIIDEKYKKVSVKAEDYSWDKVADQFIEQLGLWNNLEQAV